MYSLRKAAPADSEAMAFVHVSSWRETYKDLLDESLINNFSEENRKKMWDSFLANNSEAQRAYVVLYDGKIVGLSSWRESTDHVELLTLYVLKEFHGKGLGKALFKKVEEDVAKKRKKLSTWVLKENNAKSFYKKMGLKFVKNQEKKLGCSFVNELLFESFPVEKLEL